MAASWEVVFAELERLQASRGVWSDDLPRRIGPTLRKLAGIDDDDVVSCREVLIGYLDQLAVRLPSDLRLAALAALAVEPGADNRKFLSGRWAWLVEREGYALITARRRVDAGLRALAR